MKNFKYFAIPLTLGILLGSFGCSVTKTSADGGENYAAVSNHQPQITAKSVAGEYKYETYRSGKEGYVNSLDIKDKGNGRIEVLLTGSYIYQANGAETFKEASGAGEAQLRGNVAVADVTDENDELCQVTLTFSRNQVVVKEAEDCNFNVRLDGTYKKVTAKPKAKKNPAMM